jgi:hypothetical protein
MRKLRWVSVFGLAACAGIVVVGYAQAQIFISATGKDSNSCSRTAPCRTLQRGINATSPGRELTILTSGEYGKAVINKGMTILAEGVSANIRAYSGAEAIRIDAPGGKVVLKGLLLTGDNTGAGGINIVRAVSVHIEDCAIERFVYMGIRSLPDNIELFVSNTVSRNNGDDGLRAYGSSFLTVDNSRFENNGGSGIHLEGSGVASVTRSIFSRNTGNGVWLGAGGGQMNISEATSAGNAGHGFYVQSGSLVVSGSSAADNRGAGFYAANGEMALDGVVARSRNAETEYDHAGAYIAQGAVAWITDSMFMGIGNGWGLVNDGSIYSHHDNVVQGYLNSGGVSDATGF